MQSCDLPFLLRAERAVDQALVQMDLATTVFATAGDTRCATVCLVELFLIDYDKPFAESQACAMAAKLLHHLAATSQTITRFAVANSESLAKAFRENAIHIHDGVCIDDLLRR